MNIKEDFRLALRELVYPVCVVSAHNQETKVHHAITVSSVTSLSFDPPSILVCINKDSRIHSSLKKDSYFNVSSYPLLNPRYQIFVELMSFLIKDLRMNFGISKMM